MGFPHRPRHQGESGSIMPQSSPTITYHWRGDFNSAARHARRAGCEWLHVDFEDHVAGFYPQAWLHHDPGAGLIVLSAEGGQGTMPLTL
jgi:hypothetical protein